MKFTFLFLLGFIAVQATAQNPLPAPSVLQEAYQQAARENKHVFLIFHASWCGWCHKMDTSLADPRVKKFFDENYVIRHLTVLESAQKKTLENPGADSVLAKYGGTDQGIPFWLVFDGNGNLVADSQIRPSGASLNTRGKNSGCPATEEEVAHFIKVLQKTSKLGDEALQRIRIVFRENDQ